MMGILYILMQALIGFIIAISGLLLISILKVQLNTSTKLGLAYPLGLSFYTLSTLPFFVTSIDFILPVLLVFIILICVSIVSKAFCINTFRFAGIIASISLLLSAVNFTSLSYDSVVMISLAKLFTNIDFGISNLYPMMASWGIGSIIHQSFYMLFKLEYSSIITEALFLSFIAVLWGWLKEILLPNNFKYIAGVTTAFIVTTPFIIFQTQYFHNSLPTMALLFCGFSSLMLAYKLDNKKLILIGYLLFLTMILTRTENAILAVLTLVFFTQYKLALGYKTDKVELVALSIVTLYVIKWYAFLYFTMGEGSDILSPTKAILICLPLLLWAALSWLFYTSYKIFQILQDRILPITAFILSFLFLALIIYDPFHGFISAKSLVINMAAGGMWGATFWILGIVSLYALCKTELREKIWSDSFISNSFIYIFSFFILILIYSYARIPYRIGWGDSGNRMLTHIFPFWAVCISYIIGPILKNKKI